MTILLDDNNPFTVYANEHLWSSPEIDQQFQVKIERISPELGYIANFKYMGAWRNLPTGNKVYQVYTVGGIDPGTWGFTEYFKTNNPLDRWKKMSVVGNYRGMQIDIYDSAGRHFPLNKAHILSTYDGVTLIALEQIRNIKTTLVDNWYFRCYTPTVMVDKSTNNDLDVYNPFGYELMTYENTTELRTFQQTFNKFKSKPGSTYCFHNSILTTKNPDKLSLLFGDEVEIWHDPTVIKSELFNVNELKDYYSELDSRRKVIIHPPKTEETFVLENFDDKDVYILDSSGYGIYYHRNNVESMRQLTHKDIALDHGQLLALATALPAYQDNPESLKVLVLTRKVERKVTILHESSAIRYLYRLNDDDILSALTGEDSGLEEWQASSLEQSATMLAMRAQPKALTPEMVYSAIGYNGATLWSANNIIRVDGSQTETLGVELPDTYGKMNTSVFPGDRSLSTVNEYSEDGLLLEALIPHQSHWYTPINPLTRYIELILGSIINDDETMGNVVPDTGLVIRDDGDIQVYKAKYSNVDEVFMEDLVWCGDQEDIYWKATIDDTNGYPRISPGPGLPYGDRLYVTTSSRFLGKQFTLNHLDKTLSFKLIDLLSHQHDLNIYLGCVNYNIWMNGHHLIDNVDWKLDEETGRFYIFNKQHLIDGEQSIVIIGTNTDKDMTSPKYETELGFVENGKIGNTPTFNVRDGRVVKCVVGGKVFPIEEVANTEGSNGQLLPAELEGSPYMVKHVYQDVKFGPEPCNHFLGYETSRDLDLRVSEYLTEKIEKEPLGDGTLIDKYALFSTFLNKIVNDVQLGVLELPPLTSGQTVYSQQTVNDLVTPYLGLLDYDPAYLGVDLRFFDVFPYANTEMLVVSSTELMFFYLVNERYLKGVCEVTSNFEVNNYV